MSKIIIDTYLAARIDIVVKAVRINNLLAHLDEESGVPYVVLDHTPNAVCVIPEYLNVSANDSYITLSYSEYGDIAEVWHIPVRYFDMSDDEIIKDFTDYALQKEQRDNNRKLKEIKRMATELGYELVTKEVL